MPILTMRCSPPAPPPSCSPKQAGESYYGSPRPARLHKPSRRSRPRALSWASPSGTTWSTTTAGSTTADPKAWRNATELTTEINRTLAELAPDLVLSVGSDGLTGHPDHIAIATALRLADSPCPVLGARLRATNIDKGHQLLQQVLPGEQVGSGRVQGVPDDVQLQAFTGGAEVAQRRRAALDQYYPGLGSQDLPTLLETYPRRGDSLLLRAVFDASTWSSDEFE